MLSPAPTHSDPLLSIPTHSNPLLPTITYSHPLLPTSTYSYSLPSSPYYTQPLPLIFNPLKLILSHSRPLPLMFSSLLLFWNPYQPMRSIFHPFPVHVQIFSSHSTHYLPFQPIFSPFILVPASVFRSILSFLLFLVLFRKQLITLGLTTTFAYFQESFCSPISLLQKGNIQTWKAYFHNIL